ncbi:hypothetical protein HPP92_029162 [Vanilla planifolia]|uniref:Uncharacterized protein n=1 Tax=Vanilla planifolia TaxID=51239 RepID=A0A835P3E6_VANPL|nr:hypothetical protein HPP92_029162 [Vanilla planifolia]KAG0445809.1 hypothetical protein HPP92_029151 [Vanilla planifolia]
MGRRQSITSECTEQTDNENVYPKEHIMAGMAQISFVTFAREAADLKIGEMRLRKHPGWPQASQGQRVVAEAKIPRNSPKCQVRHLMSLL